MSLYLPPEKDVIYHLKHSVGKVQRLATYVSPGDCVYDVGAHAGLFSHFSSARGGVVLAVEPDPELHEFIAWNAPTATIVRAAVSDAAGRGTLWRNDSASQTSSLDRGAVTRFGEPSAVGVDVVTLSGLVDEFGPPDVIKLDIQGKEWSVVDGNWASIAEARTVLVEATFLDPHVGSLVEMLGSEFGEPTIVNDVYAGADLAFQRQ